MEMMLSNINLTATVHSNRVTISWDKYSDDATYILIKKKISRPFGMYDGNEVYNGNQTEVDDYDVKNGMLYYYRLFILYDQEDEYAYISDNKCVIRVIALNDTEWTNYGDYLYAQTPRDVRYQDSIFKKNNYPLQRFLNILAFPFNKIEVFSNLMIEQTDIESCDEMYLPYHAKWMNCLYDERFGADINRLILKTMNEAEPYIGTETGLKYILQRIFKAEVQISQKVISSCFTNGDGLISYSLVTNKNRVENEIKLFFDDDNQWLSNMETSDSIMKIIVNYCALRTNFSMVSNLITSDEYDKARMSDDYLHDTIIEKITDAYTKRFEEILMDNLSWDSEDVYENYKRLHEIINYPNRYKIGYSLTNGETVTNVDFVTNVVRYEPISYNDNIVEQSSDVDNHQRLDSQKEVLYDLQLDDEYVKIIIDGYSDFVGADSSLYYENYKKLTNIQQYDGSGLKTFGTIGQGSLISNGLVTNAVHYEDDGITSLELSSITNSFAKRISDELMTNSVFYEDSIVSYHDSLLENLRDNYDRTKRDDLDYTIDKIIGVDETFEKAFEDELSEVSSDDYDEIMMLIRFGMTNDAYSLLSNTMMTNVTGRRSEPNKYISQTEFDSKDITKENFGDTFEGQMEDVSKDNPKYEDEDILEENFDDEQEDIGVDVFGEQSMVMMFGMINDQYSLISSTFMTNIKSNRSEVEKEIEGSEAKTIHSKTNEAITIATRPYRNSILEVEENQADNYGGVKLEEIITVPRFKEDEMLGNYEDEDIIHFIKTRPNSLTCSECVLSRSLYTTDILY